MSHDRNCLFDIYWEYLHLNSLRRIFSETQFQKLCIDNRLIWPEDILIFLVAMI